MKKYLLLLMIIIATATVQAKEGSLTLLAVHQQGQEQIGSTADLSLEIKPGSGKVFLNTYPLTQVDTQISTRFAKDIACDYIDANCDKYDFFYTIRADSSIIGGPSAGAAAAALTIFLLKDMKYDKGVMVTGTINPGGIVGPVGGLEAKIKAGAKVKGAKIVLVPLGEAKIKKGNITIEAETIARNASINISEVGTLDDIVYQFTGKHVAGEIKELEIDQNYANTMEYLAKDLCQRSIRLQKEVELQSSMNERLGDEYKTKMAGVMNLSIKGEMAYKEKMFYSSASYCFGANVRYQQMLQTKQLKTKSDVGATILLVEQNISRIDKEIKEKELKTINDLQAYMVVSERINEAREQLINAAEQNRSADYISFAIERLYSAKAWSHFFGQKGREYVFNEAVLRDACLIKIAEAEESFQYVSIFFPDIMAGTQEDIRDAYKFAEQKQYALCLSKASNAKSSSNSVISAIGVEEENIPLMIKQKLDVGKQLIIKQTEENSFPILGYSYWEYANNLAKYDKYSALLYAQYAMELSNLDIYFEKKKSRFSINLDSSYYWIFSLGLSIGLLAGIIITRKILESENKKKNKRKIHIIKD